MTNRRARITSRKRGKEKERSEERSTRAFLRFRANVFFETERRVAARPRRHVSINQSRCRRHTWGRRVVDGRKEPRRRKENPLEERRTLTGVATIGQRRGGERSRLLCSLCSLKRGLGAEKEPLVIRARLRWITIGVRERERERGREREDKDDKKGWTDGRKESRDGKEGGNDRTAQLLER